MSGASASTRYRALSEALAAAFLDGDWSPASLVDRGAIVLGGSPAWLRRLAKGVCAAFPEAPHDALGTLAIAIANDRALRAGAAGSSTYLAPRRYFLPHPAMRAERPSWNVPPLETARDVAEWAHEDLADLAWLADWRGFGRRPRDAKLEHYVRRWMPKRSGGFRLVEAPKGRLKDIQRRLLRDVLEPIPLHEAAHGFRKGRDVITHTTLHVGSALVLRMDIEDFFVSIPAGRVYGVFRAAGYPEGVSRILTGLCTTHAPANERLEPPRGATHAAFAEIHRTRQRFRSRHLPQGAPTSPALANLCAFGLDVRLTALAHASGARYSRYADDLAFSGDASFARAVARFQSLVAAIATDEGFRIQHRKTRAMRQAGRQELTGLVVNAHPAVRRVDFDRLRATLHNCVRFGPRSQNRDGRADFRDHIEGAIAWVGQVQPTRGAKLRELAQRIDWNL